MRISERTEKISRFGRRWQRGQTSSQRTLRKFSASSAVKLFLYRRDRREQ